MVIAAPLVFFNVSFTEYTSKLEAKLGQTVHLRNDMQNSGQERA